MTASAPDYDVIIAGAGLTGLSLACWLVDLSAQRAQPIPRVLLVEPRTEYSNDRTWCFWDREPHPFRHCISQRWSRWVVRHGADYRQQQCVESPYAMIPAQSLYQEAETRIAEEPAISFLRGVEVLALQEQTQHAQVTTSAGVFSACAVIDTRLPEPGALREDQGLWQVFTGLELALPDHGFDEDLAVLMDFQPGDDDIRFLYVLPLGPDHLLVEWTAFQSERHARESEPQFEEWLHANLGPSYRILRREQGALPMMPLRRHQASSRIIPAGTAAGWMRPATGYMFSSCQRGAGALAGQILDAHQSGDWALPGWQPRSPLLNWMDRVFLSALKRRPAEAPQWFLKLFGGTSAPRLSRFMSDRPSLGDMLAIMSALPPWPFLQAALALPGPTRRVTATRSDRS